MEEKEMKKTLYKSRKDRFLFGVCGGLAEYFEVDPTLVRILTAALCTTGTGLESASSAKDDLRNLQNLCLMSC